MLTEMDGESSWNAAAGEASFLVLDECGMSKKWMKPSHDSTISLQNRDKKKNQPERDTRVDQSLRDEVFPVVTSVITHVLFDGHEGHND